MGTESSGHASVQDCIEGMQVDQAIYVTMEQEIWGHSQWT